MNEPQGTQSSTNATNKTGTTYSIGQIFWGGLVCLAIVVRLLTWAGVSFTPEDPKGGVIFDEVHYINWPTR